MLLALDPALKTGYALGENGKIIESGVWDLTPRKATKKQPAEHKYYRLEKLYWKLFEYEDQNTKPLDRIIFEGAAGFMRGKSAVESSHQFRAVILLWASLNDIPVTEVQPQDLKRWATGKGNADKDEMKKTSRRYGYEGNDDNIADAILLLHFAMEQESKQIPQTKILSNVRI